MITFTNVVIIPLDPVSWVVDEAVCDAQSAAVLVVVTVVAVLKQAIDGSSTITSTEVVTAPSRPVS